MSFVSKRELWRGRGGSQDDEAKGDSTRVWRILMDDNLDDDNDVRAQWGGPKQFDPHPKNPVLWAKKVSFFNEDQSPRLWIGTVEYSSDIRDPLQAVLSPLDKPPIDTWNSNRYTKPAIMGYFIDPVTGVEESVKTPILNSAGDAFDPPGEMDASRLSIELLVNMTDGPTWILDYNDCVNDAPVMFRGINFAAGTMKINTRIGPRDYLNGYPYRHVTIDLECRAEGFNHVDLDRGFNTRIGGKRKKITINGTEPSQPPLLNGFGGKLGEVTDGVMNVGPGLGYSNTRLDSATGGFKPSDVGNAITVKGAGVAGGDLVSTIVTWMTDGQVFLNDAPSTNVTGALVTWVTAPKFRTYRVYEKRDFSILNLPATP